MREEKLSTELIVFGRRKSISDERVWPHNGCRGRSPQSWGDLGRRQLPAVEHVRLLSGIYWSALNGYRRSS